MLIDVCVFALALLVAAVLTPVIRAAALKLGLVSVPRERDMHRQAIPRMGGVAIAAAVFAPLGILALFESKVGKTFSHHPRLAVGLLLGGLSMMALGVVDDARGVRARNKLILQIAAAILAYATGFRIAAVYVPFFGILEMGVFALPVTVLWIVGIVNAVNLIDGLAAGVIFCAALTNFVVATVAQQVFVALVMAAIMGSMVGFLFYNFNPARIFMGDSGSYFLGYVLATVSLTSSLQKASTAVSLLVPIVALGVPIFDTLFSMVRRTLEQRSLFSPDRGHVHHRLIDRGITHRRAVMILYGVSITLTLAAIGISLGRSWEIGLAILGASVVLGSLIRFVGYFEFSQLRKRGTARQYDACTKRLLAHVSDSVCELAHVGSEDSLWKALEQLAKRSQLTSVRLQASSADEARQWVAQEGESTRRDLVVSRFPLGGDSGVLEFSWPSETGEISRQTDVLLQLVANGFNQARDRIRRAPASRPAQSTAAESAIVGLGRTPTRESDPEVAALPR